MARRGLVSVGMLVSLALLSLSREGAAQTGLVYQSITPCRAVDTRTPGYGGVVFPAIERQFSIKNGACTQIPGSAKAIALNITIVTPTADGFVVLWPTGTPIPLVSNINFLAYQSPLANGAIVGLASTTPDLSVAYGSQGYGSVHVVIDVTGYFR